MSTAAGGVSTIGEMKDKLPARVIRSGQSELTDNTKLITSNELTTTYFAGDGGAYATNQCVKYADIVYIDTPTPTPTPTPTITPTPTPTITPTPTPTPTPVPVTITWEVQELDAPGIFLDANLVYTYTDINGNADGTTQFSTGTGTFIAQGNTSVSVQATAISGATFWGPNGAKYTIRLTVKEDGATISTVNSDVYRTAGTVSSANSFTAVAGKAYTVRAEAIDLVAYAILNISCFDGNFYDGSNSHDIDGGAQGTNVEQGGMGLFGGRTDGSGNLAGGDGSQAGGYVTFTGQTKVASIYPGTTVTVSSTVKGPNAPVGGPLYAIVRNNGSTAASAQFFGTDVTATTTFTADAGQTYNYSIGALRSP